MFNIKSIVKQITERSKDSSTESPSKVTSDSFQQKAEGFLCPKCMKQLPSPWELQAHYESVHDEETSEINMEAVPGIRNRRAFSEEQQDLHCSVDQDVLACDVAISSLAIEDVTLLTDVCDLQERLQQALNRKETLESRVVRLVQNNATLKTSVNDMDHELSQLRERHKILEAQLAHRESIDDAAVLRQELVQVQRVMDEMNREREKERDELQAKLLQLQESDSDPRIEILKSSLDVKEQEYRKLSDEFEEFKFKHRCAMKKLSNEETAEETNTLRVTPDTTVDHLEDIAVKNAYTLVHRHNQELKKLSEDKLHIETELQSALKECSDARRTLTHMQHSLLELQLEYQNVQLEQEQKLDLLGMTMQEKCSLLEKQENAVQLLVTERAEFIQRLEWMEVEKARESKEISVHLDKLRNQLTQNADMQKHMEDSMLSETKKSRCLQDELTTLTESSNIVMKKKNEEINALSAALDEVTGEKLALEAKLQASGIEQQKLLERCYASTSEIETFQHTTTELRRKWEESESALQDLGRENATLQLDIEKLLARKWAEDGDVTQCTLCLREFTMLLRKHHCRNCGQIFCNECSSKTAAVVSNKKPVRVCDSCCTELRTK